MSTTIEQDNITTTTNGMTALNTTTNAVTDLFFNIGASRGRDIIPAFSAAIKADRELAIRVALWSRDIRGGSGERKLFRDILQYLEVNDIDAALAVLPKIPEIGRWDDIFSFKTEQMKTAAYTMLKEALVRGDGLAAKWCPRQATKHNTLAAELRKFFGWTPKYYRKRLVELTKVVETQMCSNDWDNINFSHVPSVASARYRKAFNRHTTNYADYVSKLTAGDMSVKVNAGAIYPYDVLTSRNFSNTTEREHVVAQWDALPNFVGDANILPMVDVSGSMSCRVGGYQSKSSLSCMDVAVSLGLYLADKNTGIFKDAFLTFSGKSKLITLPSGDIVDKMTSMKRAEWGMSTNIESAFDEILSTAKKYNVPAVEMPEIILIMSDMQFNSSSVSGESSLEMIERKYQQAGYQIPKIVYWNLNSSGNVPVTSTQSGTALVSGFSPSIVKSVLSANMNDFTPMGIMLSTIMDPKYNF